MATNALPISQDNFDELVRLAEIEYKVARNKTEQPTLREQWRSNKTQKGRVLTLVLSPWTKELDDVDEIALVRVALNLKLGEYARTLECEIQTAKLHKAQQPPKPVAVQQSL